MTRNDKHISIITLTVNCLNAPIKRHRIANWVKKQDPTICSLQRLISLKKKKKNTGIESKGRKKFSKQMNTLNKLYSYLRNFTLKSIRRDNEGHFISMKGTIH
jgi:exonuclease III